MLTLTQIQQNRSKCNVRDTKIYGVEYPVSDSITEEEMVTKKFELRRIQ